LFVHRLLDHPIVGDTLYTMNDAEFLAQFEASSRVEPLLPRHALHCAQTTIWHPHEKRPLTITAPLAADIQPFLKTLDPSFESTNPESC
jgi:23S rRNA-/tRNA-specific pseudouridylate synthase